MKRLFLMLSLVLIPLTAASTVQTGSSVVYEAEVEGLKNNFSLNEVRTDLDTLYSFEINGEFKDTKLRVNSTQLDQENIDLRIADENSIIHRPTNFDNLTFAIGEPGVYHLIENSQIRTGYDRENRNCLRLYPLPDNFEEVSECPKEAGKGSNTGKNSEGINFYLISVPVIILVILMLLYRYKERYRDKPGWDPEEI